MLSIKEHFEAKRLKKRLVRLQLLRRDAGRIRDRLTEEILSVQERLREIDGD